MPGRRWGELRRPKGAVAVGLMLAAVAITGLFFIDQAAPCPAQGSLPWPIDPANSAGPPQVGMGYLQPHEYWLHLGVDILAAEGTEVRAIEAGEVAAVEEGESSSHFAILVAKPGSSQGFLYRHIDATSTKLEPGDDVQQGCILGEAASYPSADLGCPSGESCYDHLHLELCTPGPAGIVDGIWQEPLPDGNPLTRLEPRDDQEPRLLVLSPLPPDCVRSPSAIGLCLDADAILPDDGFELVCPDGLEEGQLVDVLVQVEEPPFAGSSWRNMPLRTHLAIRLGSLPGGQLVAEFHQDYDGPPPASADTHCFAEGDPYWSTWTTLGERELYLVLTNGMSADGAWEAKTLQGKPTIYRLDVTVCDASGNRAFATTTATVFPKAP